MEPDWIQPVITKEGKHWLRALMPIEAKAAPDAADTTGPGGGPCLDFIASTDAIDRFMEVIDPRGWRLDSYLRNPVFQNAHRTGDITNTLGRAVLTEVRDIGNGRLGLFQRIEFAVNVNPVAKIAYGLYRDGFLRGVSVGFIPLRWEEGNEKSAFRRRYLEQELIEVSAVAVPANRDALLFNHKEHREHKEDGESHSTADPRHWSLITFARTLRLLMSERTLSTAK